MFGLSTIAVEAIAAAVVALLIFGGGMKAGIDIEADKYDKLKASYAIAQQKATAAAAAQQMAVDRAALDAAAQETKAQSDRAAALTKELVNAKNHISIKTISANCVPYGFLRVLYAGGHGVTADSLALPAGSTDATCSPVGWLDVATAILHDYGQANANATQLNALTDLLRKQQIVLKGK